MTTVQLTDAQLAQYTACGIIVVDGEPCPACDGEGGYIVRDDLGEACRHGRCRTCGVGIGIAPDDQRPAVVAPELWRKLTEPCATCRGRGEIPRGGPIPYRWVRPCPDCAGGRQVVTLTATCPTCAGDPYPCWKCKNKSVVTLGRFTIRLLPVLLAQPYEPEDWSENCVFTSLHQFHSCWLRSAPNDDLPLDPLPQPGQWAVQFESVDAIAPK